MKKLGKKGSVGGERVNNEDVVGRIYNCTRTYCLIQLKYYPEGQMKSEIFNPRDELKDVVFKEIDRSDIKMDIDREFMYFPDGTKIRADILDEIVKLMSILTNYDEDVVMLNLRFFHLGKDLPVAVSYKSYVGVIAPVIR